MLVLNAAARDLKELIDSNVFLSSHENPLATIALASISFRDRQSS